MKSKLGDIYGDTSVSGDVDNVLGRLGYQVEEQPAQSNKAASREDLNPEEAIRGIGSDPTPLAQRVASDALGTIPGESGKTLSEMSQGPEDLGPRDTDKLASAKDESAASGKENQ